MRVIDLADGFETEQEPDQGLLRATHFGAFASDLAFTEWLTSVGGVLAAGFSYVNSTDKVLHWYDGAEWKTPALPGAGRFMEDLTFDGVETEVDVDVSADIADARLAIWQLCDNASDYERTLVSIKTISQTTVRITADPPLPAGTYRLIGVQ